MRIRRFLPPLVAVFSRSGFLVRGWTKVEVSENLAAKLALQGNFARFLYRVNEKHPLTVFFKNLLKENACHQ